MNELANKALFQDHRYTSEYSLTILQTHALVTYLTRFKIGVILWSETEGESGVVSTFLNFVLKYLDQSLHPN